MNFGFPLPDFKKNSTTDIKPRNKEQRFALHALTEVSIPLVCLTGLAGSGKTFLTLMAGLAGLNEKKYKRILESIDNTIIPKH